MEGKAETGTAAANATPKKRPWGLQRIHDEDPERFAQVIAKGVATRRKIERMERLRMINGLPRKTRMRINAVPTTKRMKLHKWRMKALRNYFYADGHPTWICHDKETRRSLRMEATATRIGLRVVEADE